MNTLNIYVVRDEVAQDNTFICTAKNDEEAKRNVKLALCSPQPNYINQHTKDKRLIYTGSIDIDTGVITGEVSPIPLFTIEEVRLELLHEIAVAKSQALDTLIKEGISKEKYDEAKGLIATLASQFEDQKEVEVNA